MKISGILSPDCVVVDMPVMEKEAALRHLLSTLGPRRGVDVDAGVKKLLESERHRPLLIPVSGLGVALPHVATAACKQFVMFVATSRQGLAWDSVTRKAHLVVILMWPPEAQTLHIRFLARLARLCQSTYFVAQLVGARSSAEVVAIIARAEAPLGDLPPAEGLPTFCVVGAGNGGMAMAAHLAITGCKVNLYNRTEERLKPIQERGGLDVSGEIEGFAGLSQITSDPEAALDNVDVVMVVTPATAHRAIAGIMAPHVKDGQIVVLNPGRTGGALEVARVFREHKTATQPFLGEAQTLLYAARITNPGQVHIFGIKNSVPLATLPAYDIVDVLPVIRRVLPQFVPGDNVLKTSMDNIGAVFHPAITLLNAGRIEETHGDFDYYIQGVTESVAAVLEAVDQERVSVANALGIRANTAREWLYLAYNAAGKTLFEAMKANQGYSGIRAPLTIQHRYISEDVPTSLVPIAAIGEMIGVPTPVIRSLITLASVMHERDYWREGRTPDRLGIAGMSVRDIRLLVIGGEQPAAIAATSEQPPGEVAMASTSVFDQPPAAA